MEQNNSNEILEECRKFLESAEYNHNDMENQQKALEIFGDGESWYSSDLRARYGIPDNLKILHSAGKLDAISSVICNKMSQRPWNIELYDKSQTDLQEFLDEFQQKEGSLQAQDWALERAVLTGAGYVHFKFNANAETEEDSIKIEFVDNQTAVYVDPYAQAPDLSDAEKVVIVNFIPRNVAKDKYGVTKDKIQLRTRSWAGNTSSNEAPISDILFYVKKDGNVTQYEIVGEKVVSVVSLGIPYIPVVRFSAFMRKDKNDVKHYVGIIQKSEQHFVNHDILVSKQYIRIKDHHDVQAVVNAKAINHNPAFKESIKDWKSNKTTSIVADDPNDINFVRNELQWQDLDVADDILTKNLQIEYQINLSSENVFETATQQYFQEMNSYGALRSLWTNAKAASMQIARIILASIGQSEQVFKLRGGPDSLVTDRKKAMEYEQLLQGCVNEQQINVLKYYEARDLGYPDVAESIRATIPSGLIPDKDPNSWGAMQAQLTEAEETMQGALQKIQELTAHCQDYDQIKAELTSIQQSNEQAIAQLKIQYEKELNNALISNQKLQLEFGNFQLEVQKTELANAEKMEDIKSKKLDNAAKAKSLATDMAMGVV